MSIYRPAEVYPPGEYILEEMEERGWTQDDLARILNKPLATINRIIKGRVAIIAETALKLAAAFETSPEVWMNLESLWQLYREDKVNKETAEVSARARFYSMVPIREMERRGWIRITKSVEESENELKRFFGVRDISEIPDISAAARSSLPDQNLTPAQWAWCRRSLQLAGLVKAAKYNKSNISDVVGKLKLLINNPMAVQQVPKVLADGGIRLVIVEHLSKTRIDGSAQWLNDGPVITLSLRFPRMDYFWFTLMHELAHVKYRDKERADVAIMEENTNNKTEVRANQQASDWLISSNQMDSFINGASKLYSPAKIIAFAKSMKVHPSIVIGQLKKRGEMGWDRFPNLHNNVKVRSYLQDSAMCDGWGQIVQVSD